VSQTVDCAELAGENAALRQQADRLRAERDAAVRELLQARERAAADDALIAQQHVDAMTYRDERDAARAQVARLEAALDGQLERHCQAICEWCRREAAQPDVVPADTLYISPAYVAPPHNEWVHEMHFPSGSEGISPCEAAKLRALAAASAPPPDAGGQTGA
jgi:hypothetical protein